MSGIDHIRQGAYITEGMVRDAASEMRQVRTEETGPQNIWRAAISNLKDAIGNLQLFPEIATNENYVDNHLSRARTFLDAANINVGEHGYRFADSDHPAGQAIPGGVAALLAKHGEIAQSYVSNPEYMERLGSIVGALTGALTDLEELTGTEGPTIKYGGANLEEEVGDYLRISDQVTESCQTYQNMF